MPKQTLKSLGGVRRVLENNFDHNSLVLSKSAPLEMSNAESSNVSIPSNFFSRPVDLCSSTRNLSDLWLFDERKLIESLFSTPRSVFECSKTIGFPTTPWESLSIAGCGNSIYLSRLRNPSNLRPLDEKKLIGSLFSTARLVNEYSELIEIPITRQKDAQRNRFSTTRLVIEYSELVEISTTPKQRLNLKHIYGSSIRSPRTRNSEGSKWLPHSIQSWVMENSVHISWLFFFCFWNKFYTIVLDLARAFWI